MSEPAPDHTSASPQTASAVPPKRKWRRRWLIAGGIVAALFVLVLLLAALLPAMISAGFMHRRLQAIASDQVRGSVTWDNLRLAWGEGQHIDNLRVLDAQGQPLATIAHIDAPDVSLLSVLRGDLDLGVVDVLIDSARITETSPGHYDLAEALEPASPRTREPDPAAGPLGGLRIKANIVGKDIEIHPRAMQPLTIASVKAQGDLSDPGKAIDLVFDLQVQQQGADVGRAQGTAHVTNLFGPDSRIDLSNAQAQANASIARLPWPVVAAFTGQQAQLGDLLGQEISLETHIDGRLLSPTGNLRLKTSQIDLTLDLAADDQALSLTPGVSKASFVLDERGWRVWSPDSPAQLLKPVTMQATFDKFVLPRNAQGGFDLAALQAKVALAVSDIVLQGPQEMGSVSLADTRAAITADTLGRHLVMQASSTASREDHTGQLELQLDARDLADSHGRLGLAKLQATLQAQATAVPVAVLDQLMVMRGRLVSLAGDELDVEASARINPGEDGSLASGPFEMALRTPRLQMRVQGSLSPEALTLEPGDIAGLQISQASAAALGLPAEATLSSSLLRVKLGKAVIPRTAQGLDIARGSVALQVTAEPLTVKTSASAPALTVAQMDAAVTSELLGAGLRMTLGLLAEAGGQQGRFSAAANVTNLMPASPNAAPAPMQVDYQVHSKALPVAMLEALAQPRSGAAAPPAHEQSMLASWLGRTIDLQASGQLVMGQTPATRSRLDRGQLTLALQSQRLQADVRADIASGMLQTQPDSHIKLTLDKAMLAAQGLTVTQDATATLNLGQIALPLAPVDVRKLQIRGMTLQTTPLTLSGDLARTGYGLSALQGEITSPALGQEIALTLHGQAIRNGTSDSPITLKANLRQPLDETRQGRAELTIRQVATAVVDLIAGRQGLLVDALGPAIHSLAVTLETHPPSTPEAVENQGHEAAMPWQFQLSADTTHLKLPSLAGVLVMGDRLTMTESQPIRWTLTPQAFDRLVGPAEADSAAAAAPPSSSASADTSRAPEEQNALSRLFGKIAHDAQAAMERNKDQGKERASQAEDTWEPLRLTAPAALTINLQQLDVTLSPSALRTDESFVASSVETVHNGQDVLDLRRIRFKGNLQAGRATFAQQDEEAGRLVTLEQLDVGLETQPTLGQSLLITMQGSTVAHHIAPPVTKTEDAAADAPADAADAPPVMEDSKGVIDGRIVLADLSLTPDARLDWYHSRSDWQLNVTRLPSALVDRFTSQQGRLAGVLGPWADLSLQGRLPGDLDLKLLSPQAQVTAPLHVTDQRVVLLRDDMRVQMSLTPHAVALLGLMNPQLLAMESSAAPISLVIRKEQFALPLPPPGQPMDLQALHADMSLDLGDVVLRKEGMVKDVFEVLAGFGGKFQSGQRMNVHFTPLQVNISQGRIVTSDMWLMTSDLLMGTQANIDLNRSPAFATVYLGISGQTLKRLPGARSNIPDSTVVDIKIAAPLSEVKVDQDKLIVQLAPMFATAYGGKDARKILQGIEKGIGVLDRLAGRESGIAAANVTWRHHPLPRQVEQQTPPAHPSDAATTQPTDAAAALEKSKQEHDRKQEKENPLESLIDLFR